MTQLQKVLAGLAAVFMVCMITTSASAQNTSQTTTGNLDDPATAVPADQAIERLAAAPSSQRPNAYGPYSTYTYLGASHFVPVGHQVLPDYSGNGYITPHDSGSSYTPNYWTQLDLPAGAEIMNVYARVYDSATNGYWNMRIVAYEHDGSPSYTLFSDTSVGDGTTPGYTTLFADFSGNYPLVREYADLDGDGASGDLCYSVAVKTLGDSSSFFNNTLRFGGIVVIWRRTISPAPATATFDDVPVGSFGFQQVEALAASGITAGCDSNNFCPNSPVTRVQMAVYLAKALGLNWPE